MLFTLTVVRYRWWLSWLGFVSMAVFHLPLLFQKNLTFYRLMGCGRDGTFSIIPDFQQWAFVGVWATDTAYEQWAAGGFIPRWWQWLAYQQTTYLCRPLEAHGLWGGRQPLAASPEAASLLVSHKIAVLTRATIRLSRARAFWQNVPKVNAVMKNAQGLLESVGIGESPFIHQATFSIWDSLEDVKQFAYRQRTHAEVVKKTRQEAWYAEELFARFVLLEIRRKS